MTLDAFTVRPNPTPAATPLLVVSGLSVIVSLCMLLVVTRGLQFQVLGVALVTALLVVCLVIVRLERRAIQLAAALVGLPEPVGGWTPTEQGTIDGVGEDGVDVTAIFTPGELADYTLFVTLLLVVQTPVLGVLGAMSALSWIAFMVVLNLGGVALGALAYAWRADVYLRTRLVPLANRVADAQIEALAELSGAA